MGRLIQLGPRGHIRLATAPRACLARFAPAKGHFEQLASQDKGIDVLVCEDS